MRTIASGIDIKNPTDTTTDTYQLKVISPDTAASRLAGVYPGARVLVAPNRTIIIMASPTDMAQIKAIVTAIDTAPPTPTPKPHYPSEAVRVTQRNVKDVARAVASSSSNLKVRISGSEILLAGPQDEVDHAKQLIAELDVPQMGTQYTQVYRLKYVDATSVADLFRRSFTGLDPVVDADLNAITITANLTVQRRIADAVAQLDLAPANAQSGEGGGGASGVEVVTLKAAVPGPQGASSTSATDMANTVTQALQASASDLHIIVPPNSTQLVLTGSPYSIKLAKELIEKLDRPQPLIAMDTEVLEVDEGVSRHLGLSTSSAVATTFTEILPTPNPTTGQTPPLGGIQSFARLPNAAISFTAQLDLLIQENKARVLENPRITTISGRTASLHAGETINILTTSGGGVGVATTTQVQPFQTGVTLDITPVVNEGDYITVSLHPSVSTAIPNGAVPNIQTRDTTTTVGLRDGETLVIGGLIEESDSKSVSKIPLLGDLPLIGRLFQDHQIIYGRNELIVTVTPHIIRPGESGAIGSNRIGIPKPEGLPTLPPDAVLPPPSRTQQQPRSFEARPSPAPEPEPIVVPTPMSAPHPSPQPLPVRAAQQTANGPAPAPLPSAFAQTNVFTYGAAPQNNYAASSAPPQIFYAQVSPSVVSNGQQMTISAITSTNVVKLEFGPNKMIPMTSLKNIGAGQWQGSFPFSSAGVQTGLATANLLLTATTGIGGSISLSIPISLVNQ